MASKTTRERSAASAQRRRERGITILRLPAMQGTKDQLQQLMAWHGITEMAEAMSLLILNAHALGEEGSAALLAVPRHTITVTPSVAQRIHDAGAREADRLDKEA